MKPPEHQLSTVSVGGSSSGLVTQPATGEGRSEDKM